MSTTTTHARARNLAMARAAFEAALEYDEQFGKADFDDLRITAGNVAACFNHVIVNPAATDWMFEGEWLVLSE